MRKHFEMNNSLHFSLNVNVLSDENNYFVFDPFTLFNVIYCKFFTSIKFCFEVEN